MSQITIELEPHTAAKARQAAQDEGLSLSQWVTRLVEAKVEVATTWPDEVKALAGAWPDFPKVEELRQGYGVDTERDTL
ncbi:MAG: hypothetical protein U5L04_03450 [Trueperaceae bacterium]|nr:hypothetical protein [Trueperaceae bacterium]